MILHGRRNLSWRTLHVSNTVFHPFSPVSNTCIFLRDEDEIYSRVEDEINSIAELEDEIYSIAELES
jgi:hypothetical protein